MIYDGISVGNGIYHDPTYLVTSGGAIQSGCLILLSKMIVSIFKAIECLASPRLMHFRQSALLLAFRPEKP